MHVAVVGAGAVGRVYGARLAVLGNAEVTFVVRPERVSERVPYTLERADRQDDVLELREPALAADVPASADVIVVCVRAEQLDAGLTALLARGPGVPLVMMTPMMPADYERLLASLDGRVVAAMPGVVAYVRDDGVVRYWVPRTAPTLIEAQAQARPALDELVARLNRAELAARFEPDVHASNPATTVTFIPLAMAIDVAGGVDALLADRPLVELALRAASEGRELAQRVGTVAKWATFLTRFMGKRMLRIGVGVAKRRSPEAVRYVEEHFGRKLHAQNVAMARAIVQLAEEKGTAHEALAILRDRLEARAIADAP